VVDETLHPRCDTPLAKRAPTGVPIRVRARRLASAGIGTAALWLHTMGSSSREERLEAIRHWGLGMMKSLNVTTVCQGPLPSCNDPVLIVSNHVSLLDICVLCSIGGTLFVAKEEIRHQLLLGRVAGRLGNFFHERGNIRDAARVKNQVASGLRDGWRITLFPEGRTSDGTQMMPFYSAIMQAAVDASAMLQPVAIRYLDVAGKLNTDAAFVGDQTFLDSVARILSQGEVVCELTFGAPICAAGASRRELIGYAHSFIAAALGLPVCSETPNPHLLKLQVLLEQ
jgi:1-acyl-sn-glycerol-3-phosphate acyltransferase